MFMFMENHFDAGFARGLVASAPPASRRIAVILFSLFMSIAPGGSAVAQAVIDQSPATQVFNSGLRVEFFAPMGQTFVPSVRRHVGVEIFVSHSSCSAGGPLSALDAIFTVTLHKASLDGPILATGTSEAIRCNEGQLSRWLDVPFEQPAELERGSEHYLAVTTANRAGFWHRASGDSYPAGRALYTTLPTSGFDMGFRTWVLEKTQVKVVIAGKRNIRHSSRDRRLYEKNEAARIEVDRDGWISATIFGSADFDVTTIALETLEFGLSKAPPEEVRGVSVRDVNEDGALDLITRYRREAVDLPIGKAFVCLRGDDHEGVPFEGCGEMMGVEAAGDPGA